MKRIIILIILMALVIASLFCLFQIRRQIKRMKTYDSMGQILVAIDKEIGKKSMADFNPVTETQKVFPDISVVRGQIVDGWGNPMVISVEDVSQGYRVIIKSCGQDGILGTKDDLIRDWLLSDTRETRSASRERVVNP